MNAFIPTERRCQVCLVLLSHLEIGLCVVCHALRKGGS
jgi:hypothetical protein